MFAFPNNRIIDLLVALDDVIAINMQIWHADVPRRSHDAPVACERDVYEAGT
jgi:hypothetical protein